MAKSKSSNGRFKSFARWVDHRIPIFSFIEHEATEYPTPRNLNYWWNFGSLAGITLLLMIVSGLWLAMQYTPHVDHAFNSVERIMRDVNGGWFLRYLHMNGASMFFIVVYIHMMRGLYYGSYKNPRELLWIMGVVILLLMMATAFMGYVLPWGQMSFWGATVITNLFSAIPVVGDSIVELLWGGFAVDNPTLNRFFVLHFLLPFVIIGVVILHLVALHKHGSNNPLGVEPKTKAETVPFHPYYTAKDLFGLGVFLSIWMFFVFFAPNFFGEPDNYIPANPLVTPAHIVPEWYFLPYYAILRCVPDKLGGVLLMFGAVFVLFIVPWLDSSPIRSATFRPLYRKCFWLFIVTCLALGWAGGQQPEGVPLLISRVATAYYFIFFLVLMPLLGRLERALPLPSSLIGPKMMRRKTDIKKGSKTKSLSLILLLTFSSFATPVLSQEDAPKPPSQDWGFQGSAGKFDTAALRRGFQVYREVCAACHEMAFLSFRNLQGMGYSDDVIKAFAAEGIVVDGPNDEGEMFERPGRASDKFPKPYPNEKAARAANNGAFPVDLSLVALARKQGPDYLFALLTGYGPSPETFQLYPGMTYNAYFPGQQIAMPPPLSPDIIDYQDGTPATVDQMSRDVVEFLVWAANPHMEERKEIGLKVLIFLIVFSGLMFVINRRVWAKLKK
ncbi:MAG: cytochrome C [bacterium]|nr:cytochrome C [bacterium]